MFSYEECKKCVVRYETLMGQIKIGQALVFTVKSVK